MNVTLFEIFAISLVLLVPESLSDSLYLSHRRCSPLGTSVVTSRPDGSSDSCTCHPPPPPTTTIHPPAHKWGRRHRPPKATWKCTTILAPTMKAAPTATTNGFENSLVLVKEAKVKLRRIGVQGAPIQKGQPKLGVENGPMLIRSSGIVEFLQDVGHDILDYGNIHLGEVFNAASVGGNVSIHDPADVGEATHHIYNNTKQILEEHRFPLTFGGDHALAIGTLSAMSEYYPDLAVIYIDAHADINTVDTSPSGNMHGMPLSFVINDLYGSNSNLTDYFSWVAARIPANNVAQIALRDVDPGETAIIDKLGMASFTMRDIDRYGIRRVVDLALDRIKGKTRPLYVSMDIDSLDDMEIGSTTGTPVPGGLTLREVLTMIEDLYRSANIVGFELAEVNPALGSEVAGRRVAEISRHILSCVFGSCYGRRV
ncbi:arginase, hepatic [Folsomia candida]|uniref:Arginase n=1 Tax=Folsomia candida TaxID=158441 RepID=A0A226CVX9_FOLCA|nr:arginase, hepatic [Folsomia candida]OXA37079.1 Arginase, hepatic [Folsomia candida]